MLYSIVGMLGLLAMAGFLVPNLKKEKKRTPPIDSLNRGIVFVSFLVISMATVLGTEGVFYYRTRFGLYALIGDQERVELEPPWEKNKHGFVRLE